MSINTVLGKALDRLFLEVPEASPFAKQKGSGDQLRRYFHATANAEREILFYRDKWWTADGGTLYAELNCLVPEVQQASHGVAQSLRNPDYSIPFSHFQFALSEQNPKRSWELYSPEDVAAFEQDIRVWLPSIALPWLDQFESRDGVLHFLRTRRQFVTLAEYLASLGDSLGAAAAISAWIEGLPRRIENSLSRLASKRVISAADEKFLSKASIQSEDDYRQQVQEWLAHRSVSES